VQTSRSYDFASASDTTTDTSISLDLEKKINEITADLQPWYANKLFSISPGQATIVVAYIKAMKLEANLSTQYRKDLILLLTKFSAYMSNKDFRDITRDDVLSFVESYRKPENVDPLHKWIGTYNLYGLHLMRFFKWLYYPDIAPEKRSKPSVVDNIPRLRRKETSIYKPSDLWTQQDDLLFLKYCPSKREKCYHAISRDLSCRPHEILKLKIKDLAFKSIGNNGHYAELVVNGKTGTRPIPLIDSIPYLKDYLDLCSILCITKKVHFCSTNCSPA
jgi:integrase